MEAPSIIQKTLSKAAVKQTHSIYSLRHTAICRRLTRSKGKVNIYSLAKNAGTSVDQIKRFYARNLPISEELGYLGYLEWVRSKNSKLKPATMNHIEGTKTGTGSWSYRYRPCPSPHCPPGQSPSVFPLLSIGVKGRRRISKAA